MISASFLAILTLGAFLFLLILLFRFFIFKKISLTYGEFKGSKAVYRIVKGDIQTLEKEQQIFTRRAQSLWGKEMRSWPTFRITYPNFYNKYAIFGIIVPDSFNCDKECLEELGFKFGSLDSLPYSARIEMPTRFCYSLKLNQYRASKTFKLLFKNKLKKKTNDHNDLNNKKNNHDNSVKQKEKGDSDTSKNIEINNRECNVQDNNFISNSASTDEVSNQIINNINEQNNLNDDIKNSSIKIDNLDDNNHAEININNNETNSQNIDDTNNQIISENNNIISDAQNSNEAQIDLDESKTDSYESIYKSEDELINQNKKEIKQNLMDFESRIESLTDFPPFAEIRYKKKKKQIFVTPLMNYNELIGLWAPDS